MNKASLRVVAALLLVGIPFVGAATFLLNSYRYAATGFTMPANLVAAFEGWDTTFAAKSNGAAAGTYTDTRTGKTFTAAAGSPTKDTFNGVPVLKLASGDVYSSSSVFDSSFDTALTVVFIAFGNAGAGNQTIVSRGGIFGAIPITEQLSGANRFYSWFGLSDTEYSLGQVMTYRYDGANVTINSNGYKFTPIAKTGNLGASGSLDLGAASFSFAGKIAACYVFNRVLTDLEVTNLATYAAGSGRAAGFSGNNVYICFGDSQTGTTGGSGAVAYPDVVKTDIDAVPVTYNYLWTNALSGRQILDYTTDDTLYDSVLQFVQANGTAQYNTAIIWLGTNDIHGGASGATTIARIDEMISDLQLRGFNRFLLLSCLPKTGDSGGTIADVAAYNSHLSSLANGTTIKYLALHTDPSLDDSTDSTYYNADGLHLKDAGKTVVGHLVSAALNPW